MQSIVDLARGDINDADKVRNTDTAMLAFANDGISRALVLRPDLKWGAHGQEYADLALTDTFPLKIEYRRAIADYVVANAEAADDPAALEQRTLQAMKMFMLDLGVTG